METCCHSNFSERPPADIDVKTHMSEIIVIIMILGSVQRAKSAVKYDSDCDTIYS